jgi:protein O-mannosyl-transferase
MANKNRKNINASLQADASVPSGRPWWTVLGASAIVLIIMAVYYPLHLAGYSWDDQPWLLENLFIRSWNGLIDVWFVHINNTQYYPMVFVVFDLAWHLWGQVSLGYHFMNVLFQVADTLLLWTLLRRLGLKSAWLAAVVFAIHPVQVETVGWIAELKNLLSAFFYFLTLLAYCRFAGIIPTPPGASAAPLYRNFQLYALALLFYLLALFSKTDVCTLPVVILILIWWKRGRWTVPDVLWTVPLFILGAVLAGATIYVEHNTTGMQGRDWLFTFPQKCIIAGRALWFYTSKIIWPNTLLPIYPRWPVDQLGGWQWMFPISAAMVVIVLWLLRKKIGRGPLAAVAIFVVTLLPVLGFIPYYTMLLSFVADHFQYLACIGLIVLATELLWYLTHLIPERTGRLYAAAAAVIIFAAGSLTFGQSLLYQSPLALWQYAHDNNPNSFYVTGVYGSSLLDAGYVGPAILQLQQSDRMHPGYRATESVLGIAYMDIGDYDQALRYFALALEQDSHLTDNWGFAAQCLVQMHRYSDAIKLLQLGLSNNPDYAAGWMGLARLYEATGQHALALQNYNHAVSLEPDYAGMSLTMLVPPASAPASRAH